MISLSNTLALLLALGTATADIFTLTASLPDSDLDGLPVNADGEAFYLGGSPASYCPIEESIVCPNVTATVFAAGLTALFVGHFPSPPFLILMVHRSRFLVVNKSTSKQMARLVSLKLIPHLFLLEHISAASSIPLFPRVAILPLKS
jgi:hypothetical protein